MRSPVQSSPASAEKGGFGDPMDTTQCLLLFQHKVGWAVSLHRDPQGRKIPSLFLASLNIFQNNYQQELMLAHTHSLFLCPSLSLLLSVSFSSLSIYTESFLGKSLLKNLMCSSYVIGFCNSQWSSTETQAEQATSYLRLVPGSSSVLVTTLSRAIST